MANSKSSPDSCEQDKRSAPTWSQTLTFTSPEADFSSGALGDAQNNDAGMASNSEPKVQDILLVNTIAEANWSGMISFASPESDFTSDHRTHSSTRDSDSTSKAKQEFMDYIREHEEQSHDMIYSLSHADAAEGDFTSPKFMNLLDKRMKQQLRNASSPGSTEFTQDKSLSRNVVVKDLEVRPETARPSAATAAASTADFDIPVPASAPVPAPHPHHDRHVFRHHEEPLPHNLQEASIADDPRAIVITESKVPFRIVSVNRSWEELCGYTQSECSGRTLECIQGPETNKSAVTALMSQLMRGEEAGTLLTNYDKGGRKFHNRLRVGPLKNDCGEVTHFVGVLKEVNELGEHFEADAGAVLGSRIHA